MAPPITFKKSLKIEFELHDAGFCVNDGYSPKNSAYYNYGDVQSVELKYAWFPILSRWLRSISWVLNGVPLFPDAETCKRGRLLIHFRTSTLGLDLTDPGMAKQAKEIKKRLESFTN